VNHRISISLFSIGFLISSFCLVRAFQKSDAHSKNRTRSLVESPSMFETELSRTSTPSAGGKVNDRSPAAISRNIFHFESVARPAKIAEPSEIERNASKSRKEVMKDVHKFLGQHKFRNPSAALEKSQIVARVSADLKAFDGRFVGVIEDAATGGKLPIIANIQMTDTANGATSAMKGRGLLAKRGIKQFSVVDQVRMVPTEQGLASGAIIRTSPTSYLQMFHVSSTNSWIGNYYSANGNSGEFRFAGTAQLVRR
jgi:hypothetical protein